MHAGDPRSVPKTKALCSETKGRHGADDEARTRYLHLGKVALYQMSYIRISNMDIITRAVRFVKNFLHFFQKICAASAGAGNGAEERGQKNRIDPDALTR